MNIPNNNETEMTVTERAAYLLGRAEGRVALRENLVAEIEKIKTTDVGEQLIKNQVLSIIKNK